MPDTFIVGNVANRGCLPDLRTEGEFIKPLVKTCPVDGNAFDRLHAHQTLASARRFVFFKPLKGTIPNDELDFILQAHYNQTIETFADKVDVVLQPETVNKSTWKRLRNTVDIRESKHSVSGPDYELVKMGASSIRQMKIPYRYNNAHRVMIGGIPEKRHPSSVKLLVASHHSPLSNGGYTRQAGDGTFFQY